MDQAPLTINQYLIARNALVTTAFPAGISALICDYFQINDVCDLLYCQGRRANKRLKHATHIDGAHQSCSMSINSRGGRCGGFAYMIHLAHVVPSDSYLIRAQCALDDPYCDMAMTMAECDELTTKIEGATLRVHAPVDR